MADLATVTMIGRLTRNPESKEAGNSTICKFSLAVNGMKKDDVSFFNCEAWGKVGEIIQKYCEKGKQIAISGTIRIDRYEDKDGNSCQAPAVTVRDMTLLGSKTDPAQNSAPQESRKSISEDIPDDLPF